MKKFIQQLRKNNALILDTETTGLDNRAELLQIGIVTLDGEPVFHSYVQPIFARRWSDAQRVHGISWQDVQDAPTISELAAKLQEVLEEQTVAVYNADFDGRMLRQSIRAAKAARQFQWLQEGRWPCVMKAYAPYWGQRNRRYGGYKWQSLTNACRQQGVPVASAHDALADAKMTAALIRAVEKKLL
ncbi:MAG: 3'-5' exonuclease [Candidatus Promineifilaceae bacterium]|nr:3'-5' exonuclease [Candidatus Promineifilaceae bacterium]